MVRLLHIYMLAKRVWKYKKEAMEQPHKSFFFFFIGSVPIFLFLSLSCKYIRTRPSTLWVCRRWCWTELGRFPSTRSPLVLIYIFCFYSTKFFTQKIALPPKNIFLYKCTLPILKYIKTVVDDLLYIEILYYIYSPSMK